MKYRVTYPVFVGALLLATSPIKIWAASLAFHVASAQPGSDNDADGNRAKVWTVEKAGFADSGLLDKLGDDTAIWKIWAAKPDSWITQTHDFEGGALTVGQTVSLNYGHNVNIATGKRVGLRLLSAGKTMEVELSFLGGGPGYERKDAGSAYAVIGKSYDPNHLFNVAFTITGPTTYTAVADGHTWQGTFKSPITAIQIFNEGAGEQSDQYTDNLIVQSPASWGTMDKPAVAPFPLPAFTSTQYDVKVNALLKQMTLQEKLGQLSQYANGTVTGPDNGRLNVGELAARGGVGSVLNFSGAGGTNALQRQAMEKSRLKIPILFAADVIHGYRTVYPVPLAIAATWNPDMAQQCARMAAVEASSAGIRWTFSPMVDIARDARWGRITEGNGEDTYLGEAMAGAWVRGYQGSDLSDPTSMLSCAKHYVGYGAAEGGREYNTVDMSERSLRDIYLPPFKATVDSGAATFMSAFNTLSGVPTSSNSHTLNEILRGEWGFKGFVVSDWNAVAELIAHGVALDGDDAALKALNSGVDMDMASSLYNTKGEELVKSGRLKMSVIDAAVTRVLRLKFALGLFGKPYTDETLSPKVMMTQEHLDLARRAAEESFVLLKNDEVQGKPLLPLTADKKVALIGPLADSKGDMLGAWNTNGAWQNVTSLRESLSQRLGDKLVYAKGTDIDGNEDDFAAALKAAAGADVVVMALGESSHMTGEAASRTELGLPGRQLELLKAIVATGKPVVLALFNGRPLALPWEAEHVPAILEAWFPGTQTGPAVARTLYGEVNPSGKLTASFPRSVGQMPLYYNNFNTGRPSPRPNQNGDGYSSAYLDQANSALFPFGWGLSYSQFEYSPPQISTASASAAGLNKADVIKVRALVKNTGGRGGAEIVQLYICQRGDSVARPVRELKGFQKVSLAPGEVRPVEFTLTKKELAFWNIDMKDMVEPGELTVWIAPNSVGGQPASLMLAP